MAMGTVIYSEGTKIMEMHRIDEPVIEIDREKAIKWLREREEIEKLRKEMRKAKKIEKNNRIEAKKEEIKNLKGITIEILNGNLWVGGKTYQNKETLKKLGFKWSKYKKQWYFK